MDDIGQTEEALHTHAVQRQSYQAKLTEIEMALEEVQQTEEAYQMIGSLMVKRSPERVRKDLEEERETVKRRLAAIETQESRLRDRMERLQKEALGDGNE